LQRKIFIAMHYAPYYFAFFFGFPTRPAKEGK